MEFGFTEFYQDEEGNLHPLEKDFGDYRLYKVNAMPEITDWPDSAGYIQPSVG